MRTLSHVTGRFGRDQRGNVGVIFTLACLPMISGVGCAVDYSRALQIESKLQAAADAASVGSIAKTSAAYLEAGSMAADGPIPDGAADATKLFKGNMTGVPGYTLNSVTPTVLKSNGTVSSTVQFSATIPSMFLGVIGKSTMTVTGTSTSTANVPVYVDYYLLLDNSPSMGVGATPDDITKLVSATSDPSFGSNQYCAFACHDTAPGAKDNFYAIAQSLNITTRMDVLKTATQEMIKTAAAPGMQTYSNQLRLAIYDFGGSADTAGLRSLFSLSPSLTAAKTAADGIALMTVNGQGDNNDQDSAFSTIFPAISKVIGTAGPGTSISPQKYLMFVSDGVADESNSSCLKTMYTSKWGNIAPRCQSPIDPSLCQALKDHGIKIAVLYTTYLPLSSTYLNLPTNPWYISWIDPLNAGPYGPSPNSEIAQNMASCASPGLYFEVSPTQGISEAMGTLFKKTIADARVSK